MKNKAIYKPLSLLLALTMVLGCLAGCTKKEDDTPSVEDLRDSLAMHTFGTLTFYLGEDFDLLNSNSDYAAYGDGNIEVFIELLDADHMDADIDTLRDLVEYYIEMAEDGGVTVTEGKANGVTYLLGEADGMTQVVGLYKTGDTLAAIAVSTEKYDQYQQDVINYATLGVLAEASGDTTRPTGGNETTEPSQPSDQQTLTEHDVNGLLIRLPESFVRSEGDNDMVIFTGEGMEVAVSVMNKALIDSNIQTAEDAAAMYMDFYEDGVMVSQRFENGVVVNIVSETDGSFLAMDGFYVQGRMLAVITLTTDDYETYGADMLRYATTCELPEDITEEPEGVEYDYAGLHWYMPGEFELLSKGDGYVTYNGEIFFVTVGYGSLELEEQNISNAQEFAEVYAETMRMDGAVVRQSLDGVPVVIVEMEEYEEVTVAGFYTAGDIGWVITADADLSAFDEEALIAIVRSGWIVESEIQEPEIPDEPEDPDADLTDTLTLDGLTLNLGMDCLVEYDGTDAFCTIGEDVMFAVCKVAMEDIGLDFDNAPELTAYWAESMESMWEQTQVLEHEGVPYMLCQDSDGMIMLSCYYVDGGDCWEVSIVGFYLNELEMLIPMFTSGTLG